MTDLSPRDTDIPVEGVSEITPIESEDTKKYDDAFWLGLASENFSTGRNYQDAALTNQWERNADHFNNRHYRRSAYTTKLYKGRSRIFRPLTRAAERSGAAQFAAAIFSNQDIVNITAMNQSDPEQLASARMMKQLLHYRLEKSISWFLTCLGTWQDTRVYGPCATYTTWKFVEKEVTRTEQISKDVTSEFVETIVLQDEPVIEMIPPEGLLMDPACDWRDPINSSPWVTRLVPMYIVDVEERMNRTDPKTGQAEWFRLSREQMQATQTDQYNTVRQAREGDDRPDKMDSQDRIEFKIVWAHENYVRLDGEEYVYWTMGTQFLLSSPKPLRDVYLHGKRPITYGFSIIEAHKFSPSSPTELISNLQQGSNDIANLRIDNIRLALNKRYIIRRGAQVDLEALMMSVPGGGIFTENVERDIKVLETRDVTASSYKEQERMETESNDLTGTFLGGSVQNNRALNETVGGMEMLSEGSNAISELDIKTYSETFLKPQLELLMAYIRAYESDETVLNTAFEDARKESGFETPDGMDDMDEYKKKLIGRIRNDYMTLKVNVGMGANSPQRRATTLSNTVSTIATNEEQAAKIDWDEVTKEMFSINGYQDGARFLKSEQEDDAAPTEEDVQGAYEQGMQEGQDAHKMASIESTEKIAMAKLELERELRYAEIALKEGISIQSLQAKLQVEQSKDATRRDTAAAAAASKNNELEFKRTTGKPGI